MASTKSQRRLLECLGDEDAIRHLLARWEYLSMEERWKMLTDKQATTVVLHHTYPRIDSNVSLKVLVACALDPAAVDSHLRR